MNIFTERNSKQKLKIQWVAYKKGIFPALNQSEKQNK
jgi:hypothetical protein